MEEEEIFRDWKFRLGYSEHFDPAIGIIGMDFLLLQVCRDLFGGNE